ncbi:MAG: class I SAM-dependent methyltransferase [Candidatus Paceibacterota bacterium]
MIAAKNNCMADSEKIKNRFDLEPDLWSEYHNKTRKTVIEREVYQRKALAKRAVKKYFQGRPAEILEVGCGTGDNLAEIVQEDEKWYGTGVDISPAMVQRATEKQSNERRLSFREMNIEKTVLDKKYDVVLLLGVVGYFGDNQKAFDTIFKALKPGGLFIFTYGNKKSIFRKVRNMRSKKKSYFRSYYPSEMKKLLPPDGKIIEEHGLIYSTGFCKGVSVAISTILEKVITQDRFDQALTKLVIVRR